MDQAPAEPPHSAVPHAAEDAGTVGPRGLVERPQRVSPASSSRRASSPESMPMTVSARTVSTRSAPPTIAGFAQSLPPSMLLRTKNLPMSAFTSSSTTTTRPYRPGEPPSGTSASPQATHSRPPQAGAVPAPPLPTKADPFASLGAAGSGPSTSTLPGTTPRSTTAVAAFSLRLPPAMSRVASSASTSTIPEGKTLLAFPPRLGAMPSGALSRGVDTTSSLPTQGAGAAYGLAPRERQHHKSFPGVGAGQSVSTAIDSVGTMLTVS